MVGRVGALLDEFCGERPALPVKLPESSSTLLHSCLDQGGILAVVAKQLQFLELFFPQPAGSSQPYDRVNKLDFHIVDVIIIVHRPRPLCNDRYQKRARESKKVTGNVGYSTLPARCLSPSFDTAPLAAQQHPLGSSRDASVTPIAK
jgi:hypothetical protein